MLTFAGALFQFDAGLRFCRRQHGEQAYALALIERELATR